jgi:hypothetical protein
MLIKWLIKSWLKVDESQKQELWIKRTVAKEICGLSYNKIFGANVKIFTFNCYLALMEENQL